VPDYPGASGITLRQAMTHTSGVFDYADNLIFLNEAIEHPERVWKPEELLPYAASQDPYFAPGEGFHYSNTGYIFAGMAVEAVTGRRLSEERILFPLIERHIPKLSSLLKVLHGEHAEFRQLLRRLGRKTRLLMNGARPSARTELLDQVYEDGLYFIYLMRNHFQAEANGVYREAKRILKPKERVKLADAVSRAFRPGNPH
jgi:hypothetical protein